MTNIYYFIFLACLLFLNIAVLYSYFLSHEFKENEKIHNEHIVLTLKLAYPIQVFSLIIGAFALFYFSSDKAWFYEIRFLYFLGLALIVGLFGLLPQKTKALTVICCIPELAAIIGFAFLLPENDLWTATSLPPWTIRVLFGTIWFIIYKFFNILSDRFDGIFVIQSIHMGFAALIVFLLLSFAPVSWLHVNGMLLPIMLMLTPFYCIFQYKMPITNSIRNIFCLLLTGLAVLTIPAGQWGLGVLMISYILFELAFVIFHFPFNLFKKEKEPLFFFENLMNKTPFKENVIRIIMHYNFLTDGLIFILIYLNLQAQVVALTILLYLKMYMNIMSPDTARTGILDLFKEAKKTAQISIKESTQAFSDLKQAYNNKKASENKGQSEDEQS
ncbi:MAG: hypothetical protein IJ752_02575 [Alphaproteobacteria bacterium]|nr:hypothetical protein [Alphaproteobacteria bacterium]